MFRIAEKGQALVLTAVALVALLAALGLAIDMGVLRYDKRLQQTAADAAALAGAADLINASDGAGSQGLIAGAMNASAKNGFADTTGTSGGCSVPPSKLAVNQVTVTVCNPPQYGPHAGDVNYVEAFVSAGQPTYFVKVLGVDSATVGTRAVATARSGYQLGGGCLWALLPPPQKGIQGFTINGSATLDAPQCGVWDNGDYQASGGTQLNITADTIGVSGSIYKTQGNVSCTSGQTPCPASVSGITDPMAGQMPSPPAATSPVYTLSISGTTGCTANTTSPGYQGCLLGASGDLEIQPGSYCSITMTGVTSPVIFEPGIYVIGGATSKNPAPSPFSGCGNNNSLNIPGNGSLSGTGVTFYFTNGSTLNMTGTPLATFSAPSSGTYANLLFWQDPNDWNTTGPLLSGTSGSQYNGIVYFPNDSLTFGGTTSSFSVGVVIAGWVNVSGNPYVHLVGPGGLPSGQTGGVVPTLVE